MREKSTLSHLLQMTILFPIKAVMPLCNLPTGSKELKTQLNIKASMVCFFDSLILIFDALNFHISSDCVCMTVSSRCGLPKRMGREPQLQLYLTVKYGTS